MNTILPMGIGSGLGPDLTPERKPD